MNALEIQNVTKHYEDFSLGPITIMLPAGCIMGFIGENGAGKTTTIKLILDLIRRDSGKITILGKSLDEKNVALKEQIGVVMDDSSFPENLTAQNINTILKSCYKTWDSAKFEQFCAKFELPDKKRVHDYSRGMKMKLSIAVALSHGSRLLILDEATSGLDPIVRDEILDLFLEFIQDERNSIFLSSHIISDLEKICDYITFIHRGKILISDEKDMLLNKYVVAKLTNEQYGLLDPEIVIGARSNSFGVEALMCKDHVPRNIISDPATLEDIMLYSVKERLV